MADQPKSMPNPQLAKAMGLWGIASKLAGEGRWAEASESLRRAVEMEPSDAAMWSDLGVAEQYCGELGAAAAAYERSLALEPGNTNTLANYGFLLVQLGRAREAIGLLKPALESGAATALIWTAAGHAYRAVGDEASAVPAFREAVELAPNDNEARHNLAVALRAASRLSEAMAVTREVLAIDPGHAEAWHLLGGIAQARGDMDEAMGAFRRSVELAPSASRQSSLLMAMQYADDVEPIGLLETHREWDAAYARGINPFPPRVVSTDPERKLRIGFVSSQFGMHPIGFLALGAIECLDKSRCEVACYSGRSAEDEYTKRFRGAAELWRVTTQMSVQQLAAQIREDEIDVLVDLMGHTGGALLAFAYRPAALQVSWLGYVGTTGLSAMDCLLADGYHVRPGEEGHYTEKVLRMPHGYACYSPPSYAPEVNELPALANGCVTFGCFNNPAKFSPSIIRAWVEILGRVPNSNLLLKYFGLDDQEIQQRIRSRFAEAGVETGRIVVQGGVGHAELLASYHQVDLALDTQPYSGGLTTCETLWMGVPVVTWPGRTFAGRHSVSHLINAGLAQFVATNRDSYIDLAVAWTSRLEELALIRAHLREQMRKSPLCDAQKFAEDFLGVLREAWLQRVSERRG
jgi:protein O-GlcNAc transferase